MSEKLAYTMNEVIYEEFSNMNVKYGKELYLLNQLVKASSENSEEYQKQLDRLVSSVSYSAFKHLENYMAETYSARGMEATEIVESEFKIYLEEVIF